MTAPESDQGATPNGDPATADEAKRIAEQLDEPLVWLIENVVKTLGLARTEELLQATLEIQEAGGMDTAAGDRKHTPGGVFIKLMKERTTPKEQEHVFYGGPKPKREPRPQGAPNPGDPPPITPLSWDDARTEINQIIQDSLEKASVKITLVGRPTQVSKTKSCVVVALKGSRPPSLPKGLPPAPDGSDYSYAVFISLRHWSKVAPVMAQDKDEKLLIEGYPIFDPKRGVTVILAQNVRTMNFNRRKQSPGSR